METKPILDVPAARELIPVEQSIAPALVVDLDGTVLKTDLLLESLLVLLKQKPQCLFLLPGWLLKGKAYLKQQVARRAELDVSLLPYRTEFLEYLKARHDEGRSIILATAADRCHAKQVADHLKIFDLVFASDGITNLAGESKRDRLVGIFGAKAFDYAANDRPICRSGPQRGKRLWLTPARWFARVWRAWRKLARSSKNEARAWSTI